MPFIDLSSPQQTNSNPTQPSAGQMPNLPPTTAASMPMQPVQQSNQQGLNDTSTTNNLLSAAPEILTELPIETVFQFNDTPAPSMQPGEIPQAETQNLGMGELNLAKPLDSNVNKTEAPVETAQSSSTSPFSSTSPVVPQVPTIKNEVPEQLKPIEAPANLNQMSDNTESTNVTVPSPQPEIKESLPSLNQGGIELTGSAAKQTETVEEIFKKADELVESKQTVPTPSPQIDSLKPADASENYYAQKAKMDDFLAYAEEKNASDLHISTGYPPMLRVDGKLISIGNQIMQLERVRELFESILTPEQQEALKADLDIDFSHSIQSGTRFRVNIYHKKEQLAGAFRLIPSRIRTIAELGLPDVIYDFAKLPHGLVLVTGPTGHGKSTTLASIIQEININEAKHIITIEDPIEYVFPRAKSLVDQREVGTDVKSFSRALRAALREDPDVVLVGEMRDFETIASAITVAETGHLVFSTLHTNSAAQSIDRMIDVFPDAQQAQIRAQLANVISAVVAQRLVPVQRGGRKAVLEIMIANAAIKNAIREGKTYQIDNMIQTSAELGMITLEKSLVKLIRSGDLTVEAAQNYTAKPDELLSLLKSN